MTTKRDSKTKRQIKMMVKHSPKRKKIIKTNLISNDCKIQIVPAKKELTNQMNATIERASRRAKKNNNNHLILLRKITLIIMNLISNRKNNNKICKTKNKKMRILLRILDKLKIRIGIHLKNKSRSQMAQKKNLIITKVMIQVISMSSKCSI